MQHRDKITIWKIIEEIDIGIELLEHFHWNSF